VNTSLKIVVVLTPLSLTLEGSYKTVFCAVDMQEGAL